MLLEILLKCYHVFATWPSRRHLNAIAVRVARSPTGTRLHSFSRSRFHSGWRSRSRTAVNPPDQGLSAILVLIVPAALHIRPTAGYAPVRAHGNVRWPALGQPARVSRPSAGTHPVAPSPVWVQ